MPLVHKQTLVILLNVALAVAVGALLWQSLAWPLIGDAAIFHFIAGQMQMGAAPYRDIIDINTGTVIDGDETIEEAGARILDYIIKVASGEEVVSAVRHGQEDFIPWKRGVSL